MLQPDSLLALPWVEPSYPRPESKATRMARLVLVGRKGFDWQHHRVAAVLDDWRN